jgi:hypothetical protein
MDTVISYYVYSTHYVAFTTGPYDSKISPNNLHVTIYVTNVTKSNTLLKTHYSQKECKLSCL